MSLVVDIKKQIGDFLLEVSFTHQAGTLALLGQSGAGKSVTMACIAGILTPDSGTITLDGVTLFDHAQGINLPPQKRGIGLLFQGYALFPNMTVWQNVACGLHQEKDKATKVQKIAQMLDKMQLSAHAQQYPSQLSGGQQQRVAIARTLICKPNLLIFDEPFSALDTVLRHEIERVVAQVLADFGGKTILITHNTQEAYSLSQSLLVMEGGKAMRCGETHAVFADPQKKAVAQLMGCENIIPCQREGEHTLYLPTLGQRVRLHRALPEACLYLGVFSNDVHPTSARHLPVQGIAVRGVICARGESRTRWLLQFAPQMGDMGTVADTCTGVGLCAEASASAGQPIALCLPKKECDVTALSAITEIVLAEEGLLFLR